MAQNHQTNNPLYKALSAKYIADIEAAKATMIIYFDNPVAIGEHPQHLSELDKLNDKLANAEEKLASLTKHFNNTQI